MAYSSFVGSFNIDTAKTATQTQAITGVGFQPKIVLFWWGGSTGTGDTVAGGTYNIGFGAAISDASRFCINAISEDAQADSDSLRSLYSTEIMRAYTDTGTLDGILDFVSMDAGGFTVIIDDQFTQTYRISYLALGGTDLTNVAIGNFQNPADTGNYDITSAGFQPDAALFFDNGRGTLNTSGAHGVSVVGMATGSSNQGVVGTISLDNQATTDTAGYSYSGEVDLAYGSTSSIITRSAFVSFLENGFRLNKLEGTSVQYVCYIALKGGQYSVGNLLTRTDGNDIAETVGFQPVALLFASANRAESTQDTPTEHTRLSFGAATSTSNRACAAISDEDNLADSETAYANYDSAVYANIADDAIVGLMDIKSIESDGFTCVMDDTDPSNCWVTYLAIGATPVVVSVPRYGFILHNDPGIV